MIPNAAENRVTETWAYLQVILFLYLYKVLLSGDASRAGILLKYLKNSFQWLHRFIFNPILTPAER